MKRRTAFLLVPLVIALIGALGLIRFLNGRPNGPLPPSRARGQAVIFDGPGAASLLAQCSRPSPAAGEGVFAASWDQIDRFEAALRPLLAKGKSTDPLSGVQRQYLGLVRGGRRYIYGNFLNDQMLRPVDAPAPNEPVTVCDGGVKFFGAEFDLAAGKVVGLAFNGSIGGPEPVDSSDVSYRHRPPIFGELTLSPEGEQWRIRLTGGGNADDGAGVAADCALQAVGTRSGDTIRARLVPFKSVDEDNPIEVVAADIPAGAFLTLRFRDHDAAAEVTEMSGADWCPSRTDFTGIYLKR